MQFSISYTRGTLYLFDKGDQVIPYTITYSPNQNILAARLHGKIRKYAVITLSSESFSFARQQHCSKFVCDWRSARCNGTLLDIFSYARELSRLGLKRSDKVAFVAPHNIEEHQFFEIVVRNRGWNNIRYFQDKESAVSWLNEESSPCSLN